MHACNLINVTRHPPTVLVITGSEQIYQQINRGNGGIDTVVVLLLA